jgi:hypothetical protein
LRRVGGGSDRNLGIVEGGLEAALSVGVDDPLREELRRIGEIREVKAVRWAPPEVL